MRVEQLARVIRERATSRRLTISGGEPLEQTQSLVALLDALPGFEVALYTGKNLAEVSTDVLHRVDYIKVGAFMREKATATMPFVGSSNQRFLRVDRQTGVQTHVYEKASILAAAR